MKQPSTILETGTMVRTHKELDATTGMVAAQWLLDNRRPDVRGEIYGVVPGHGGDVYWVKHEDGRAAPYYFTEFELTPQGGFPP